MYDYQLVRLTEGQQKEEKEALEKANEVYFKHSMLKQKEKEMSSKLEETEKTLNQYKAAFEKNKKALKQDHDTYVSIKDKTKKELDEQIAIQKQTELSVNEALQQKADLRLKELEAGVPEVNSTAQAIMEQANDISEL